MKNKVILVTLDGVRYQDLKRKINNISIFQDIISLGTIYKNVLVKNPVKLSNPGYNEILTGNIDLNLVTNLPIKNINKTLPEKLVENKILDTKDILISTIWSNFIDIYNVEKSGLNVITWNKNKEKKNTKLKDIKVILKNYKFKPLPKNENEKILHDLKVYKIFKKKILEGGKYRFLHLALGLTDKYAHKGNYQEYLNHILLDKDCILDLICTLKNNFFYQKTYIIITTDHGRGKDKKWTDHFHLIKGSEKSWCLVIGPDIPRNKIIKKKIELSDINKMMKNILLKNNTFYKTLFNDI